MRSTKVIAVWKRNRFLLVMLLSGILVLAVVATVLAAATFVGPTFEQATGDWKWTIQVDSNGLVGPGASVKKLCLDTTTSPSQFLCQCVAGANCVGSSSANNDLIDTTWVCTLPAASIVGETSVDWTISCRTSSSAESCGGDKTIGPGPFGPCPVGSESNSVGPNAITLRNLSARSTGVAVVVLPALGLILAGSALVYRRRMRS